MSRLRNAWRAGRISFASTVLCIAAVVYMAVSDAITYRWGWLAADTVFLAYLAFAVTFQAGKRNPAAPELLRAVRACKTGDILLSRDDHIVMTCRRDLFGTVVTVMDEDDFTAIDEEGRGPVVATALIVPSGSGTIVRRVSGFVFDRDGRDLTSGRKPRFRTLRELSAIRRGLMDADPSEVRQVIGYLHSAERASIPDRRLTC